MLELLIAMGALVLVYCICLAIYAAPARERLRRDKAAGIVRKDFGTNFPDGGGS
jgi:uncharacterized membrane protein